MKYGYTEFCDDIYFKSLTWIFVHILRRPRGQLGTCL